MARKSTIEERGGQPKRRGRPVTGSPERIKSGPHKGRISIRVPIPGTTRTRRVTLGPEIQTEARATEVARHWNERLHDDPELLHQASDGKAMTNGQYLEVWTEHRRHGLECADDDLRLLKLHVFDDRKLRDKLATQTSEDDLRGVVARLDDRIRAGEMAPASAQKLWAKVRCMFADMARHKSQKLRIRTDSPAANVQGPEKRKVEVESEWLYPSECAQLLASEDVSLRMRRYWALLFYTGMRPNELAALRWRNVDLDRATIRVREAIRARPRKGQSLTKAPKSNKSRDVHIVPALLPVLRAMKDQALGDRVISAAPQRPAALLRAHLEKAGVERADLFESTETHRWIEARDARASTATWLGMCMGLPDAGEEQVGFRVSDTIAIKAWLGHSKFEITERHYLRGRSRRLGDYGTPFAPLPPELASAQNDAPPEADSAEYLPNLSDQEGGAKGLTEQFQTVRTRCRSTACTR